jgi:hypothetical protein
MQEKEGKKEAITFLYDITRNINNPARLRDIFEESTLIFSKTKNKIFFTIALVSYLLSKVIQKPRFRRKIDVITNRSSKYIGEAVKFVNEEKFDLASNSLNEIIKVIKDVDEKDSRYVFDIEEKGKTKIAAVLYAIGFSLETSVLMTGAQMGDVLNYSGRTKFADRFGKTISERERLKIARKLIKKGK